MRILLLIFVGISLCVAFPEVVQRRPRLRGPRRFALASPAIPSQDKVEIQEQPKVSEVAPARSRTPQLRRRVNSPLKLRNKTPGQKPSGNTAKIEDNIPSTVSAAPRAPSSGGRRGGIKIRRPARRRTTTTTTTTTVAPELEIPNEETKIETTAEEANSNVSTTTTLEPIASTTTTQAPRKKKLRPLPIKIGFRRQSSSAKQKPSAPETEKVVQPSNTQPKSETPSRHRFATRNRTPLGPRIRTRGPSSKPKVTVVEKTVDEVEQVVAPRKRIAPVSRRQPSRRLPTRTRTKPATEEKKVEEIPKEIAVQEVEVPQSEPEIRFVNLEELRILAKKFEIENEPKVITTKNEPKVTTTTENEPKVTTTTKNESKVTTTKNESKVITTTKKPLVKRKKVKISSKKKVNSQPPKKSIDSVPRKEFEPQSPPSRRMFDASTTNLGFRRGGDAHETLIGTVEDTPRDEVRKILSGFGSRRRGFGIAREPIAPVRDLRPVATKSVPVALDYSYDDMYDYLYEV